MCYASGWPAEGCGGGNPPFPAGGRSSFGKAKQGRCGRGLRGRMKERDGSPGIIDRYYLFFPAGDRAVAGMWPECWVFSASFPQWKGPAFRLAVPACLPGTIQIPVGSRAEGSEQLRLPCCRTWDMGRQGRCLSRQRACGRVARSGNFTESGVLRRPCGLLARNVCRAKVSRHAGAAFLFSVFPQGNRGFTAADFPCVARRMPGGGRQARPGMARYGPADSGISGRSQFRTAFIVRNRVFIPGGRCRAVLFPPSQGWNFYASDTSGRRLSG